MLDLFNSQNLPRSATSTPRSCGRRSWRRVSPEGADPPPGEEPLKVPHPADVGQFDGPTIRDSVSEMGRDPAAGYGSRSLAPARHDLQCFFAVDHGVGLLLRTRPNNMLSKGVSAISKVKNDRMKIPSS